MNKINIHNNNIGYENNYYNNFKKLLDFNFFFQHKHRLYTVLKGKKKRKIMQLGYT